MERFNLNNRLLMFAVCTSIEYDLKNDCYICHTGVAVELPYGYGMLLFPRSSNRKTDLYLPNSVGVVDSNYRGEIMFCYKNRDIKTSTDFQYSVGERIGQLIIFPYPKINFNIVDELSNSERGEGGFGSTGK